MNDKKWNGNPTFVMKSSRLATETALQMDTHNKKTPMTECIVFMDGLHLKVKDDITLTLWVENPIICNAEAHIRGVYIRGYRECYNISAELPGYSL